jgi:hypothetical protein
VIGVNATPPVVRFNCPPARFVPEPSAMAPAVGLAKASSARAATLSVIEDKPATLMSWVTGRRLPLAAKLFAVVISPLNCVERSVAGTSRPRLLNVEIVTMLGLLGKVPIV